MRDSDSSSTDARQILVDYVSSGLLMQVATLGADGSPAVCNVWYQVDFDPDVLRFLSRRDREHSTNIRHDRRVAGSIVAIPLEGLGQVARGVTFSGQATELSGEAAGSALTRFLTRWPAAGNTLDVNQVITGAASVRPYEIAVDQWVLFDELHFPSQPRRIIRAHARLSAQRRQTPYELR